MERKWKGRVRSASEPALRLQCGGVTRERRRESQVEYETGRDRAALSVSRWSAHEVCAVLYHVVCRCDHSQLNILHTSMESVPHRDLQLSSSSSPVGVASVLELRPLSTPLSREVRVRLRKSRRPQYKRLYRAQSVVFHDELPVGTLTPSPTTPHHRTPLLPSLPTSTLPPSPFSLLTQTPTHFTPSPSPHPPTAHPVTPRRHILTTPLPHELLTSDQNSVTNSRVCQNTNLPPDATHFLTWFSSLSAGWQQQEVLHMFISYLSPSQLYFLSALLRSRKFRDPVECLPEALALRLLSFVPPKDLLRHCTTVSRVWRERCTSETLWKQLCSSTNLGVPRLRGRALWRELFLDSLRMKLNWWRGRWTATALVGHTGRVLCVRVRGDLVATGSSDSTIRMWSLESGRCVQVLTGHSKGVWCLSFYGKRLLISGSSDHSVKVWNMVTGVCESTATEAHSGTIWCLQQKKEVLITGSHDKSAVLWSARSLEPRLRLEGHGGVVLAAELSDCATTAFTGAGDGLVRVWRVESGECVRSVGVRGAPPITCLSWSKGWLGVSSGAGVSVWDTLHWRKRSELAGHEDRVECVQLKIHDVISGRGLVVTSSRDTTVRYWTSGSGRCISTLRGHRAAVNSVSSCPWAIASASDDTSIRLWNFHHHYPT